MAKPQVKLFHHKEKDMLCGEVIVAGAQGVAQSRAVVPLSKIRRALRRRAQMSGFMLTDSSCGRATMRVAGAQLCGLLATAAKAPMQATTAKPQSDAKRRVVVMVKFAQSGQLHAKFGGWEQLFSALCRKRQSEMNAAIARGVNPAEAEAQMRKKVMFDVRVIQLAQVILDDDDMSGEEHESTFTSERPHSNDSRTPIPEYPEERGNGTVDGFSFRKAFRTITQPHTLITDRFRKRGGGRRPAPQEQEQEQESEQESQSESADNGEPQDAAQSR